jgi:hypothetical protein
VASIALFTALAVSTDYAMLPLSNVKLMDTFVFVCSLVFGLSVGIPVAALTWLVYGSINPYGSAGGTLLLVLILSETVYALFGSVARRTSGFGTSSIPTKSLLWGSLGLIGAFLYDVNTIVALPLLAGVPLQAAVVSLFPAVPFMLAHEISDFVFFAIVGPVLVSAIIRIGRLRAGAARRSPDSAISSKSALAKPRAGMHASESRENRRQGVQSKEFEAVSTL